jgi:hypothetical protein
MSLSSRPRSSPACGIRCAPSDLAPATLPENGRPLPGGCSGGRSEGGDVLVVFVDHAACAWLHLLKRGFRHCFAVLRVGPLWIACEPLKDRIDLDVLDLPPGFDLARFYAEQGHQVLLGRRPSPGPRRHFELAPLTCVTVVKRLLAIHAPWVCTPAHLHAHLVGPACGFRPWSDRSVKAEVERRPGARNLAERRA